MAFLTQGDEIIGLVGALRQDVPILIPKCAEGHFMVHIVLTSACVGKGGFRLSAHLAGELVPGTHALPDLRPVRAIIVGGVGPQAVHTQGFDGFIRDRDPVPGGLQVLRRQVEWFAAQGLMIA